MSRDRIRTTDRDRLRAQAREQTQRLRHELELLADPDTFVGAPTPGSPLAPPDEDSLDEADGDDRLTEGDADDVPEPSSEETDALTTPLRRLLGTQPPVALLRLTLDEEDVLRARLLLAPQATV